MTDTIRTLREEIITWLESLTPSLESGITFRLAPGLRPLAELPATGGAWETTRQFHVIPLTDVSYGEYIGPGPELRQGVEIHIRYMPGGAEPVFDLYDLAADDVALIIGTMNLDHTWSSFTHLIIRPVEVVGPEPSDTEGIFIVRIVLLAEYFRG